MTRSDRPTVGLFTHGAGDPNSEAVWAGVESVARKWDANLLCFPGKPLNSPHGFEAQSNAVYRLASPLNIDGLIIWSGALSHRVDPDVINDFFTRYLPVPIVSVGDPLVVGFPGIVVDNYHGMRDVITHLVEYHNLKRIAFVRGPELQPEAEQRYRAYRDVLNEHNIPFSERLVVTGDFKESGGASAVAVLLDGRREKFDALVAASDNMAIGAMKALQARGFRVPADIAVAGFNDEEQARFITPPLTTAPFRSFEMARRATELLLSRLGGDAVPAITRLPSDLVTRQSCGCPDPLVVAAGQVATTSREPPLPAALAEHRAGILAEMGALWGAPPDGPPHGRLEDLLDAFAAELLSREDGAFLLALEVGLQSTKGLSDAFGRWHTTISALRRAVLPHIRDRAAAVRAENLWTQARVTIAETGQRARAYLALEAQNEKRLLADVNQWLSNAIDQQDLEAAISRALPTLGIRRCFVSLYETHDAIPGLVRMIIACDESGLLDFSTLPNPYPALWLAPPSLLPSNQRYSLVIEPLYFRHEQLGFAVLEAAPHQEETCEILRDQIAGAIKRAQLYRAANDARDVAEEGRRLAEDANRLKSHFLATVSHELRTPLSLIVGTVEMMLKPSAQLGEGMPEGFRRDLTTIRTGAQHLAHLISDVLDLASSQAGELRLHYSPVPLGDVLSHAAVLGCRMADEKGLSWSADIAPSLPTIWGDRTRLEQVVLNLISNAVKFTDAGEVSLRARVEKSDVVVSVQDTGIGIPLAEQDVIFDEFRQSSRTAIRGYHGIGLGLAISSHLVELHGGRIGVQSSGQEGKGSSFFFTLPALPVSAVEPGGQEAWAGTVLVLTRKVDEGRSLVEYIEERGFCARELAIDSLADWLERVRALSPGAVILDGDLPGEVAWSVADALRENATTQDVPILFYSLPGAGASGAVLELDYLRKPVGSAELARALERRGLESGQPGEVAVLVVDDDPCILELHCRMIRSHLPGARLIRARNGREALEALTVYRPDLVMLDLMMPEVDGFGVLEAMHQMPTLRDIPVIVLTARSLTTEDMARLQGGVAAVLSKGLFTAGEVLSQVESALSRSKRLLGEPQRIVRSVMGYIHENYARPVRSDELAALAGLSERHLNRCFSQEVGMTPMKYLHRYRLKQAKALLEQGDRSITEIALSVGFADNSHFTRAFREEVGASPSAYRRGAATSP